MKDFKQDVLGDGFFCRELELKPDHNGPQSASLIYHPAPSETSKRAVLYLHGYIDYFFQKEMAEQFAAHDFHFFALDLRYCGRSLKDLKLNNYITDLKEYFEEIDQAVEIIKSEFEVDSLVLKGHSTGGLLATLYIENDKSKRIRALLLDSPFYDFNVAPFSKNVLMPLVGAFIGKRSKAQWPKGSPAKYLRDLHVDNGGEWDFNTDWKPYQNIPLFITWLKAIRRAQKRVHKGMDIRVPVLLMHSAKSYRVHPGAERSNSDVVLNVEDMKHYGRKLGKHYTELSFDGALHHLILSRPEVRSKVYIEMFQWLHKNLI